MKAYLNASEVAKLLNVDRATVARWLQKGLIPRAIRVQGKQQWRIPLSAYEELVKQQEQYESH
jgi:excisionase family DNA binding protein